MSNIITNVKLFSEPTTPMGSAELIVEQKTVQDRPLLRIKGPFLVAETRNCNGRLYKQHVLKKAVDEYREEYIKQGKSLGELNHPADRFEPCFEEACIKIDRIEQDFDDPNVFMGSATVLQSYPERGIKGTKNGDIVGSLLAYGIRCGISSRGLGTMTEDKVIDDYYKLTACDIVYNPSGITPKNEGCYVDGILESKTYLVDIHGNIMEQAINKMEDAVAHYNFKNRTDVLRNAFSTFLADISKH